MNNVFGLISGIDSGALINAIIASKRVPIQMLQARQGAVETKISKIGEISSKLKDLGATIEEMTKQSEVLSLTGTSANEDIATIIADGDASPGSYTLDVTQLAVAEKNRSDAFGSEFDDVRQGTLSIAVDGGADVDIDIDSGDSLATVRDKINAADAGVDASIIFDGTEYHLQLVNQETGFVVGSDPDDAIEINESYSGGGGSKLNFSQTTQATNAEFDLDGIDVEVRTNDTGSVLEGVTLQLHATGSTSFEIAKDKEGTKENIQAFVDAYNAVWDLVHKEATVGEGVDRNQTLAGEAVIRNLRVDLSNIITREIADLAGGALESLAQAGIETEQSGKIKIDSDALDDALDADINAVGKLFTVAETGISASLESLIELYTDGSDSLLEAREDAFGDQIDRMQTRIDRLNTRITGLDARLRAQFSALESTMAALQQQGASLAGLGGQSG